MTKIALTRQHDDSLDAARRKVNRAINPCMNKFGLLGLWKHDVLRVGGKGVNGRLSIADGTITVDIDLGLPASWAKERIELALREQLHKAFS